MEISSISVEGSYSWYLSLINSIWTGVLSSVANLLSVDNRLLMLVLRFSIMIVTTGIFILFA